LIQFWSGLCSTVSGLISLGTANDLRTVIFPKRLSFHREHWCRHSSNSLIFGFKFSLSISLLLLVKVIPSVVALLDVHLKCMFLQKFISVFPKLPRLRIVHLSLFTLRPEMFEKNSIVVTRVWNDFLWPSVIKQASSAKSVCLSSIFPMFMPLISLFKLTSFESNSIHVINK